MRQGLFRRHAHLGIKLEHVTEQGEGVGPHGGEEDGQGYGLTRGEPRQVRFNPVGADVADVILARSPHHAQNELKLVQVVLSRE